MIRLSLITLLLFVLHGAAYALKPDEVLVLVNRNEANGLSLAEYYMNRRSIPGKNLLQVRTTTEETCSRKEFEEQVIQPVQRFLGKKDYKHIRCIVSFYGLPLRIASPGLSRAEEKNFESLQQSEMDLQGQVKRSSGSEEKVLQEKLQRTKSRIKLLKRSTDRVASFDSELSLVKTVGYSLDMWLPNPHYARFQNAMIVLSKNDVLMTSRLDGPDPDTVRRIIDDSILAEKNGLSGTAYFDARWNDSKNIGESGYLLYDHTIHQAFQILKENGSLGVVLEETTELFQKEDCPDAALYCGWYSVGKYVDAFAWQPGSVGYHIASQECQTLKRKGSRVWCKKMIEDGVAATIGPVGEPYVQAFPPPDIFFKYLIDGEHTLAEAYLQSLPYVSWKMVLIGDPLYRLNLSAKAQTSK